MVSVPSSTGYRGQGNTSRKVLTQTSRAVLAPPRRPTVSLCIPAFQAEQYLQTTIDSVLAQTYGDLEIVIVDNGSSDGTADIVGRIDDDRVRVIRNPTTLSLVDNFNLAVRQCHGDYVKLVCADDVLQPDCVAAQAAVLESHPGVALVASRTDYIDDEGLPLVRSRGLGGVVGRRSGERVVRRIVRTRSNPVGAPVSTMFRRCDFDRSGGFQGDQLFTMDVDLWVRLLQRGDFFGLPQTLAAFRIRSGSATGLTSARSQLAQQAEFIRGLVNDDQWHVSGIDRLLGWLNAYDKQLRRCVLFKVSSVRATRRRRRLESA